MRKVIGSRYLCLCCGRVATITDTVNGGHDPDDPPGYIYTFQGELGSRWISTHAASIRFKKIQELHDGDV